MEPEHNRKKGISVQLTFGPHENESLFKTQTSSLLAILLTNFDTASPKNIGMFVK